MPVSTSVLRIRQVQSNDIITVVRLAYENLPERYNPILFNTFYQKFAQGFLVAEHEKRLAGFLVGIRKSKHHGRILMLAVTPQQRRKGIGSALLASFLLQMKKICVHSIELEVRTTNTIALCFYSKHGFAIQRVIKGLYQNGDDAYLMHHQL